MATGDAALAEGFTPVNPAADIRLGYNDINRLGDWAAGRTKGRRVSAAGSVAFTNLSGNPTDMYTQAITVNFPTGRFSAPPIITTGVQSQSVVFMRAGVADVTTTSFTLFFVRANDTSTTVHWIAQQAG